jgi:HEAT repeat protein
MGKRAVPALVSALRTERRSSAVQLLGKIGEPSTVPAILEAVHAARRDLDGDFIFFAVEALREIGDSRALQTLAELCALSIEAKSALTASLRRPQDLSGVSEEVRPWLEKRGMVGMLSDVLPRACIAVGMIGGDNALAILQPFVTHDDVFVREAGITGVAYLIVAHPEVAAEAKALLEKQLAREKDSNIRVLLVAAQRLPEDSADANRLDAPQDRPTDDDSASDGPASEKGD